MATTTKSTRKKTAKTAKVVAVPKTSKKPAASAVKTKTTVTSKVDSKKDVKKSNVSAKRVVKKPLTLLERLKTFHTALFVMYLIFAGLVIGFVTTASKAVTLPIAARDEFSSKDNVVLGTAHEVLYNIEPKYVLVLSLVIGALASLLFATKLRKRYEATIANRTSGLRWVAMGLSAALLFEYLGLLAGITDVWVLKLSGALILLAGLFGWIAERDNVGAVRPKWLAYVLSLVAGALAWLPVIGSLIGTTLYSDERFSWYVYAISAVLFLGSLAFARAQYRQLKLVDQKEYELVENRYLNIDMLTKFAIVLITLIALK